MISIIKLIEKVIDLISRGIEALFNPFMIRRQANARAYEILVIERAKAQARAEAKEIEAAMDIRIKKQQHLRKPRLRNATNTKTDTLESLLIESDAKFKSIMDKWYDSFDKREPSFSSGKKTDPKNKDEKSTLNVKAFSTLITRYRNMDRDGYIDLTTK